MLTEVLKNGTASGLSIGRPAAGKTGTTDNNQDAWFIGYTPQLTTAVWMGDPNAETPMTNVGGISVFGATYPARHLGRVHEGRARERAADRLHRARREAVAAARSRSTSTAGATAPTTAATRATTPTTTTVTPVAGHDPPTASDDHRARPPHAATTGYGAAHDAADHTAGDRHRHHSRRRVPDMSADELEALLLVQEHDTARDRLRHRRAALPERAELEAQLAQLRARRGARRARSAAAATSCSPTSAASTTKPARSAPRADEVEHAAVLRHGELAAGAPGDAGRHRHARRQRSDLEDQELEVMEARETLDAELAVARRRHRRGSTAEIERLRAVIAAAEAEIDAELAEEDAAWAAQAAVGAGVAARRLRAAPRAEQGRGRGPARRHVVHRVPPVDPVDRSRADPPGGRRVRSRTATTAARSSSRDARRACRSRTTTRDQRRRADPVLRRRLARQSRTVGDRRGRVRRRRPIRPSCIASVSECIGVTTNNVAEYKALIAGLEAVAHLRAPRRSTCAPTRCS